MSRYPGSLTEAEWEVVREIAPDSGDPLGWGRPCDWSKREIIDAILYVVRGGIPWRMMPSDLPHWKTVYHYCRLWAKAGVRKVIHADSPHHARDPIKKLPGRTR